MLLINLDSSCLPGFSEVGGCARTEDGGVACVRDVGTTHIRMTLSPAGDFFFTWQSTGFVEVITGQLAWV